ncbi:M64 family metallopeptidase [Streptacidiphilus griseoplanus]|uniref:M64 family metallopeptidase n=1 Tax=Peterkaempfera griseoplana TaxID=66896 RepID=UPI0006E20CA1|nr:M64 family metallopeptidase [Peterkaempfera griseoplana]
MSGTAARPRRAGAALALSAALAMPLLCTASGPPASPGGARWSMSAEADLGGLVPPPVRGSGLDPRAGSLPAVDIRRSGDPRNRITLVLLGDGFTVRQLGLFRAEADRAWRALMQIEPFRTYQHFFNIRRVEIASRAPGINEQRSPLRLVPTPLGMHFWCDGTARLLCVDEQAAVRLAGPVHGPHYVIAIANSARYGGAGGAGVTTLAGGNPDAGRILQHEMGHTLGELGDEYDSAPADADYPNLSTDDAQVMLRGRTKWWRWLGAPAPGGGVVGAYRGANGLYRPTLDSVMRTLGGVYNPPSEEAVIKALYRQIDPLDAVGPAPGPVVGHHRLWVRPIPLADGGRLQVVWRVDGRAVRPPSGDGTWLDPADLRLPRGRAATVTATVRDTTDRVRDEQFRNRWMTRTVRWTLRG